MSNDLEKAREKAKSLGYEDVKFLGEKGIYRVYCCKVNSNEENNIGLPLFLLENDNKVREALNQEIESLMPMLKD